VHSFDCIRAATCPRRNRGRRLRRKTESEPPEFCRRRNTRGPAGGSFAGSIPAAAARGQKVGEGIPRPVSSDNGRSDESDRLRTVNSGVHGSHRVACRIGSRARCLRRLLPPGAAPRCFPAKDHPGQTAVPRLPEFGGPGFSFASEAAVLDCGEVARCRPRISPERCTALPSPSTRPAVLDLTLQPTTLSGQARPT